MRKINIFIFLAAFLAGCTREMIPENENLSDCCGLTSIIVRSENSAAEDRASLGQNGCVLFSPSDSMAVIGNSTHCFKTDGNGSVVTFSGNTASDAASDFYAVFPYGSFVWKSAEAGKFTVNIPNYQVGVKDSFDPSSVVSVGRIAPDGSVRLMNVCALAKISITSDDITSVSLCNVSGAGIAGKVSVTVNGDSAPEIGAAECQNILLVPSGGTFAPGDYYIPVAPSALEGGIQFCLTRNSDDEIATKKGTNPLTFVRSRILDFGAVDSGLTWTKVTKFTLNFTDGTTFTNPFSKPSSIAGSYKSGTYAGEDETLETSDGLVFPCHASIGFVRHNTYGFRVCGVDGDYVQFPKINGLTPVAFRSTTVKPAAGSEKPNMFIKDITTGKVAAGCSEFTAGTGAAGKKVIWHIINPSASDTYAITLTGAPGPASTSDEGSFTEFRSARWEFFYIGEQKPAVGSVTTGYATAVKENRATLNGKFTPTVNADPSVFTCGFEYKLSDAAFWTSVQCPVAAYSFSYDLTGLASDTKYLARAWAADENGKTYGREVGFVPSANAGRTIRILGVGNSWTRDAISKLSAIANNSGYSVIVGHGYLGGSSLSNQFKGIDSKTYTFDHDGHDQVVHSTYQYWKYNKSNNAVKTPSDSDYNQYVDGNGVTLEYCVKDEPWDVVIFQPSNSLVNTSNLNSHCGIGVSEGSFSIPNFIKRIKQMMEPEVAAKAKFGLMAPWGYAYGSSVSSYLISYVYSNGFYSYSKPATQAAYDACMDPFHNALQSASRQVAEAMDADYFVNCGLAILKGRHDPDISQFGFKLQRANDNTHLSTGIPMYLASLMYAYEILGMTPEEVNYAVTGDGITDEIIEKCKQLAWSAQKGELEGTDPELKRVSTKDVSALGSTTAKLNGSLFCINNPYMTGISCGFEYRTDGGWTSVSCSSAGENFSCDVEDLVPGTRYTYRAWAECGGKRLYGNEMSFTPQASLMNVELKFINPSTGKFVWPFTESDSLVPTSASTPKANPATTLALTDKSSGLVFTFHGHLWRNSTQGFWLWTGSSDASNLAYLEIPAVKGKKIVSVYLKLTQSRSAAGRITDTSGAAVSGGADVNFSSTMEHTWNLAGTSPEKPYRIVCATTNQGFPMSSVQVTYGE